MENYGKDSCTGRLRNIDIIHFFVKDRVDKGELPVEYCQIELMIADHLTKASQGRLFQMFRELIMGWKSIDDILLVFRSSAKERIENRKVTESSNRQKSKITFKDTLLGTSEALLGIHEKRSIE